MLVSFRRVRPDEVDLLCELDVKIFGGDGFESPEDWEGLEIYFIVTDQEVVKIIDQQIVGSIAFRHHSDISENYEAEYPHLHNSLYLVSIGILLEKQGEGIGSIAMTWLIDYARRHGFTKLVSNARKSNLPSIRLHQKFGFETTRIIPEYYERPDEDAIVFELNL